MPDSTSERTPHEQQLDVLIAKYLQAGDERRPLDQADFIRQHPEFAAELREFFADNVQIKKFAPPIRPDESGTVAFVGRKIRDYQMLDELGKGGMGIVYLAMDTRLSKKVALKVLGNGMDRNPKAIARFKWEMKAVGNLDHPHIVRALHAGEENGTHFLAMEYIDGRDLGRHLQIEGRLQVSQACDVIRQAALGLQHAHDNNLVHRDVKPSNLILSTAGVVKVLDLGLAHLQVNPDDSSQLTSLGTVVGTLLYMAPEQWLPGHQPDARSDIFSLGVTFYSFLVGKLPLSRSETATQLPAIGTQRADVPPDVQELLEKMLTPNPDERIQTMSEVARLLEVQTKVEPTIPEPVPPPIPPKPRDPPDPPKSWVPDFLREHWRQLAIGGAAAAVLWLVVTTLLPNPKPHVPANGTITIVTDVPDLDLDLIGMIAISKGNNALTFPLKPGPNELPPGPYHLFSPRLDLQLFPNEIVVVRGLSTNVDVKKQSALAWLFPILPKNPGDFLAGSGKLWMKGMSEKDGTKEFVSFSLTLRMGGPGVDDVSRWMEVEVVTHVPGGDYRETGLLLVDTSSGNSLSVKRGWLTGGSESIKDQLRPLCGEIVFPKGAPSQLAVEFDKSTDAIGGLAAKLDVEIPEVRISVQDVLILLFGAEGFPRPQVSGVRDQLVTDSKRDKTLEQVDDRLCMVVRSDKVYMPGGKSEGYYFASHPEVPFGMVKINVDLADFIASFKYKDSGPGLTSLKAKDLEDEVAKFELLPLPWARFDESSLPKAKGAMARYLVTIFPGGGVPQSFSVSLRMADAMEAEKPRWLEVKVTSGTEFEEEALVSVLDQRDKGGKFDFQKGGWILSQGETFGFEGDRELLELGLLKLGKKPTTPSLLTIHDVLALLFGAKLPGAPRITALREEVSGIVTEKKLKRVRTTDKIDLKYIKHVQVTIWTLSPKTEGLEYEFCRNADHPFDFLKTTFYMEKFRLNSELEESIKDGAPSPLSFTAAEVPDRQIDTVGRVNEAEMEKNWRIWAWKDGAKPEREWAEFRGMLPSGIVRLKYKRLGKYETPEVPLKDLSEEDQKWINLPSNKEGRGRIWNAEGFKGRAAYVRGIPKDTNPIYLKIEEEIQPIEIPFDVFSPPDQEWLKDLDTAKKDFGKRKKGQ